ncbi:DUF3152 domain-containing protein, partial [Actinoplanes sp. NPDC024001]|uniref:DUF3152 domain-containing protein n=1 Tax=Actinoplanes sp. NPDC024001 TaxID=3154598 RepID=UPI003405F117
WAAHPDEPQPPAEQPTATSDAYPVNRPHPGLPESVHLPAELPDNLWPPHALLERHTTENLYVPAPVLPDDAHTPSPPPAAPEHEVTGEVSAAQVYVPSPPDRAAPEVEPEPAFLPDVLSRADHAAEDDGADDYVPAHSRSSGARHAAPSASPRMLRRRRRAMLLAYLVVVVVVLVAGHQLSGNEEPVAPGREAAQPAAEPEDAGRGANVPAATPQVKAAPTPPAEQQATAGEFRYAKERGPMLGTAGQLYRFQVAVEKTVDGTDPAEFAGEIDRTLGDNRSWVNDGRLRLRRVTKESGKADFTIYLASARTSEQMCATGGLQTAGFTSCRVPGKVIINADRWAQAVPDYAGHLAEYRRYAINHEVGHELGHGHETCPKAGAKAPVMMQQTYGLKGCTRNAWPYLGGKRYAGAPMA